MDLRLGARTRTQEQRNGQHSDGSDDQHCRRPRMRRYRWTTHLAHFTTAGIAPLGCGCVARRLRPDQSHERVLHRRVSLTQHFCVSTGWTLGHLRQVAKHLFDIDSMGCPKKFGCRGGASDFICVAKGFRRRYSATSFAAEVQSERRGVLGGRYGPEGTRSPEFTRSRPRGFRCKE
jgi:hypothetical protein